MHKHFIYSPPCTCKFHLGPEIRSRTYKAHAKQTKTCVEFFGYSTMKISQSLRNLKPQTWLLHTRKFGRRNVSHRLLKYFGTLFWRRVFWQTLRLWRRYELHLTICKFGRCLRVNAFHSTWLKWWNSTNEKFDPRGTEITNQKHIFLSIGESINGKLILKQSPLYRWVGKGNMNSAIKFQSVCSWFCRQKPKFGDKFRILHGANQIFVENSWREWEFPIFCNGLCFLNFQTGPRNSESNNKNNDNCKFCLLWQYGGCAFDIWQFVESVGAYL